jgi:hypothetical protein
MGAGEQVAWTILVFTLVCLEIRVAYQQRDKHDLELLQNRQQADNDRNLDQDRFEKVLARFDELQKTQVALNQSAARLIQSNAPQESLKQRALRLSNEVLRFLVERQANEVPLPRAETWDRDTQAMIGYMQQTMALYSERFGARVIAIRNELATEGLRDQELDRFYEHPTNPIGIRIVGERIGALAQQLRQ